MSEMFTRDELDLIREWFDATEDMVPEYLDRRDYDLADKICDALGVKRPRRARTLSSQHHSTEAG